MNRPLLCCVATALLLSACSTVTPPRASGANPPQPEAMIQQAWATSSRPAEHVDALAVWPTEDGGAWLIAAAEDSNQLVVFDGDSGQRLRTFGSIGSDAGQFKKPSGLSVWGDLVFVAERDNHRIQVLQLPDFVPRGLIGTEVLNAPEQVWLHETAPDELELLVTDSDLASTSAQAQQTRVHRFKVQLDQDGQVSSTDAGQISGADTPQTIQSIAGDPVHDRLLIINHPARTGATLHDYSLESRAQNKHEFALNTQASGLALWDCDVDDGWWLVSDRQSSIFRLYDRMSLAPAGSFTTAHVNQNNAEALYAAGTPRFPNGVLFVQHDDQSVSAFDLRDVGKALHLQGACLQ